jgi:hypothetical protein
LRGIEGRDEYDELYIRTQYDGKDLMSVEEIYYYDEEGDEQTCEEATNACIDITTCADQGRDLWPWIRTQVELRLKDAGIVYQNLYFDDDRGSR